MATQYPTALDGEAQLDTSIAPTATLGNPSHSDQHENVNGAVQALEAKLGIGASAAASSTDQMVLVSDGSGTSWGYRGVAVFANAAARDAAVTSPEEGMTAYLQDANSVTVYSGSAWVTIADLDVLVVDSANGRVGINTTPTEVLHVATASGSSYLKQENGTATTYLGPDSANTGLFGTSTAHPVRFITNNTERVRVLSDGRVGIGTDSPNVEVEVSNESPVLRLTDTDTVLSDNELSSAIEFYSSDTFAQGVAAYVHADGDGATGNLQLRFGTGTPGGASDRMTIDASGNVGIGTDAPSEELEVSKAGDAYVKISSTDSVKQAGLTLHVNDGAGGTDYWTIYHSDDTNHDLTFFSGGSRRAAISTDGFLVTVDGTNFYELGKYYSNNNGVNISSTTAWSDIATVTVPKGRWLVIASGRFEYSTSSAGREFWWRIANKTTAAIYNNEVRYQTNNTSFYQPMAISDVVVTGGSQVIAVQAYQSVSGGSVASYARLQVVGVH